MSRLLLRGRLAGATRRLIAGVIALPLSVLPFVAYGTMTAEGRLVRGRVVALLRPPKLPQFTAAQRRAITEGAPRYRDGVMVLAYHGINSSDAEGGFVISPKRFAEHLATLRSAGMNVVTAADVAEAWGSRRPLPDNAVMISFDDGRADAMMFADPVLKAARMRATMFVITGAAERPGLYYASWGAIESYARSGRWDIESHTATSHHEQRVADGRRLPALTSLARGESLAQYRARVRADLAQASSVIRAHIGRRPIAFAYPFGAYGAERTNDPAIRGILRQEVSRRYTLGFHQDDQATVPLATSGQDPLSLRRLEVGNWSGLDLLARIRAAAARTTTVAPAPAGRTPAAPAGHRRPTPRPSRAISPSPTPRPTLVPAPSPGTIGGVLPPLPPPLSGACPRSALAVSLGLCHGGDH